MPDLVGNQNIGFLMTRLISVLKLKISKVCLALSVSQFITFLMLHHLYSLTYVIVLADFIAVLSFSYSSTFSFTSILNYNMRPCS